ncbi:MAG: hypothetical protein PHG47_02575 [Sulfuricella sp.]|nr:hypothetical protein [Sulfuricella sp.]
MNTIDIEFKVRDKGGKFGGQILAGKIQDFDWEEFKKCPNAEAFVGKAYIAAAKKQIREQADEGLFFSKNTLAMEDIVTDSITYRNDEIEAWAGARDWRKVSLKVSQEQIVQMLLELSRDNISSNMTLKERLAEMVATLADKPTDPVADYLFSKLTSQNAKENLLVALGF